MVRVSHILMLVVVCCMVSAAMACAPCSTADFPPPLKPCMKTKLEGVVCELFHLAKSIVGDVKIAVAFVLIIFKLVLELLKALGFNVGSLLAILISCYDAAKGYENIFNVLQKLLNSLIKVVTGVLNSLLKIVKDLLGGILG